MLAELAVLDEMDASTYEALWGNLAGIAPAEFVWRPHPEANSIQWILGHLLWYEEWVPDAIAGQGLYLTDKWPRAYSIEGIPEVRERFDAARERYRASLGELSESDLERSLDHFGTEVSLRGELRIHTLHLSGHRYQIRSHRGTFSRAFGFDKSEFDPW